MRKEETPLAASSANGERKENLQGSKSKLYDQHYTSSGGRSTSRIVRVSNKNPCAVCGKDSWCYYSDDGAWAGCMRVQEGSVKEARNGNGYIHVLRPGHTDQHPPAVFSGETRRLAPLAGADRRDAVYRSLLGELPLKREHADDLRARGYSDSLIAARRFSSMPDRFAAAVLCEGLAEIFGDLRGVPGFYPRGSRWRLNACNPGLLVPYCDERGRILAMQIRRDVEGNKKRYVWLSSARMYFGTSPGTPVHYARPELAARDGIVIVTEGAIKADLIADRYGCAAVAVPGVATFVDSFAEDLRTALPRLRTVIIAYDADWRDKPKVCDALVRLTGLLEGVGLEVAMLDWDIILGKGLDDLLRRMESEVAR